MPAPERQDTPAVRTDTSEKHGTSDSPSCSGVQCGWFGPFETFCANLGISRDTERLLRKSLAGDDGFAEINQKQVFVTAEAGWRHLKRIATESGDGVAVPRPASGRKGRR